MPVPQPHRLLIVDDDPSIHTLIRAMLAGTDWESDSAYSADDALVRLETHSYGLLLADVLMPGMDGLTLLGQLRTRYPGLPVVIMTVKNTPAHLLGAMQREAAAYLSKPFSREMLLNNLREAILTPVGDDDIKVLSDKADWISLQIRCRIATAARLTRFIRELPNDLEPSQREEIAAAFREMLMNAVEHGGHLDPEKTVDLSYIRTGRSIVYYIRDPGEGFSAEQLAHAAVGAPGDSFQHVDVRNDMGIRPGGFGMLMAKSFADELIYSRKGNEVLLIKYL